MVTSKLGWGHSEISFLGFLILGFPNLLSYNRKSSEIRGPGKIQQFIARKPSRARFFGGPGCDSRAGPEDFFEESFVKPTSYEI